MKKQWLVFIIGTLALLLFSGCSTGGSFVALNVTNVELSNSESEIVAKDVGGTSTAGYLFGFSYSTGNMASTLALVRVDGTATLYDTAVRDLWKNYEGTYGSTEGKKLALVNIRYDADMLNLFIYTKTTLYIHADVVEFK